MSGSPPPTVWCLLLVAIVNLVIGFALAVSHGRRERGVVLALPTGPRPASGSRLRPPPVAQASSPARPAPASRSATPPAPSLDAAAVVPDALLNPIPVPVAANAAVLSEDTPRESSTEQLARLDRHTDQYHRQLATLDDQLRRAATPLQADDLSSCVERLEAAHDEFLTQQNALDQIDLPIGASAELEAVHRRLVTLWQQQCTAIGEAQQALSAFEPAGDLSRQREALIDRNHRLLSLGHELRDTLGETMVAMPRAEMEAVRRGATASGDDELLDRFQLDAFLAKWWTEHAGDEVPLAAAAVDIDELAQVNRQCGPLAGDHVLSAVAQVVASVCGKECPVCHFSGDTFLVLLPTIKLHDATALIARIRQQASNKNLKLGITEWNHTASHWGPARSWLLTLYNALNAGRMLNMYQRLGDVVRIANRSNMTNSECSGVLQTSADDIYFTPCYPVQRA